MALVYVYIYIYIYICIYIYIYIKGFVCISSNQSVHEFVFLIEELRHQSNRSTIHKFNAVMVSKHKRYDSTNAAISKKKRSLSFK